MQPNGSSQGIKESLLESLKDSMVQEFDHAQPDRRNNRGPARMCVNDHRNLEKDCYWKLVVTITQPSSPFCNLMDMCFGPDAWWLDSGGLGGD